MTLLVDQGNSRWKIATPDGLAAGKVDGGDNADLAALRGVVAGHRRSDRVAVVASVAANAAAKALQEALESAGVDDICVIRSTDALPGISLGYRDRTQLGVDRALAMVAARARCRGPFCVVDAGTAVTIDCVDADGMHLGGFILPGQRLARDCLLARTAIPAATGVEDPSVLGRDTASAIAKGSRLAVVALVERLVSRELGSHDVAVFIGGGDASPLATLMPMPYTVIPELVLEGLAVMLRQGPD